MKRLKLLLALAFLLSNQIIIAQTGPGGVGNAAGTSGQPKNVLWLDASTLALADGADIATWTDLSGNSNDLTQSNASFTPIFQDDVSNINGHPRAEFSKNNNRIVINPFSDMPTSGITNFVIYKTAAVDGNDGLLSYNTTGQDNAFLLFNSNNLRMDINGSNQPSGQDFSTGSWLMMSQKWKSSGGDLIFNRNGDQIYSTNFQNGITIPTGGSLAVGGEQDSPDGGYDAAQDYDGEIAEVIMYNSFLNSAQCLIIENYLSQKYNLSFATASNDKFGNDANYNSNYVYNIAGIGQETDGDHTQTSSGGMYLYEWNSSLANGEYVMLAHDNTTNNSSTTYTGGDLPSGTEASWARQWYFEKTSSDGIDAKLIFDFKEALSDGKYPANVANYVLLYRNAATGAYSKVTVASQGTLEADQVYFNVTNANLVNGYYTIGTDDETNSPVEGVDNRTWYALASGDWNDWNYWTLDPSGSIPNNPSHEIPSAIDKVVIQTGKTITMINDNITVASITVDGILQLGTTSGHNFTKINGSGRIRLASDNFPAGDRTDFVTAGQGEGTVVWQGGSYNLSTPQTFFNMEIGLDAAGNALTLLADYTLNGSLTIETGILQINDNSATTNLNISVTGDVLVETNGQILTGTGNARHQFDMYGDFTNNGIVKFTNRVAGDFPAGYSAEATNGIVDANFLSDNSNQTILCNGTTNFYRIEIDKGSDMTYELSIEATATANFKLYGYANQAHGSVAQLATNTNALGLLKGTVRIKSNVEIPHLNRNGNYNISEAARLWVDGGTVSTSVSNAIVPYGEAKISAGTFEALVPQGFTLRENGAVVVEGGTLNANQIRTSVLGASHVGSYIQTGGTTNIINPGNNNADYYHFSLTYPGNVFNMSGGTLHVFDANGNDSNSGGIFIASDPQNINLTGGTVIAEIASTTNPFKITSTAPFYNLILRNTYNSTTDHLLDAGTNINNTADADLAAQPLVTLNDLTIEDDCFLDNNGQNITIGGDFSISENTQQQGTNNYGLLYDAAKPYTLTFNGSGSDTLYIGHDVDDGYELYLSNLTVNKSTGSEIVLKGDPNKDPTQTGLSAEWHNRLIKVNDNIDVKNGTFNQGHQSIRLYGPAYIRSTGILGVYEPGITPRSAYIMLKDDGTSSTDLHTEKGSQLGNLKLNPQDGKHVGILSDTYIKRIGYYNGSMNLRTYNLKVDYLHRHASTTNVNSSFGSTNRMIYSDANASDGGLSVLITGNGTYTYPIGTLTSSTRYTPAVMTVSNYSDDGYVTIRPVDGELKTTNLSGGDILSYYWRVGYEGFTTNPTVQYEFKYDISDDDSGNDDTYYPGKVLDEDPFTRSYENDLAKVDDDSEGGNYTITFNDAGSGFTLENANYTAGVANRFVGSPEIFYTFKPGDGFTKKWNNGNNWTYGLNGAYDPHDSRQVAAGDYPKAGDIAVIGWVPYGDPGGTDGDPHGIAVDGISVDFALIKFSQMEDISGNPTARQYAYNFQFRPTVVINNAGGALNGSRVSGEGLFWMRWGGSQADPDFSNVDIGDFVSQDSSYFVYESKGGVYNNVPSEVPNLLIAGNGWGAVDQDFELATDLKVNFNFELLGDVNLILSSGATGDVIVDNDLRIFRSNANGNDSGGFGRIDYPNDASRSIEVYGDMRLENEQAIIRVANPNTTVNESNLILHGNIIQDNTSGGGVQFYSAANEDYIKLTLKGAGNHSYSVTSGAIANFYNIEFNKGTDQSSTFTFNDDFNLNGPTSGAGVDKALELQNGTLILDDAGIDINLTTGDDNFSIPSTAALEVRQGIVNANGNSGILLDGKLLIDGGSLDMSGGDNFIQYSASGSATIDISTGTLTVGSQIRRGLNSTGGILSFTQSGGTVIIGENTAPEGNRGVFEILNAGSSFTHTGGDLYIVRQQTNPTFAALYLDPETSNLAVGTTITLGNANTPTNQEFGIYSIINLQNLTLNNTSSNNPKAKMWTVPLTLDGELTIQASTEFKANGLDLNCYGDFTNAGTFTANQNTTYFKGGTDQEIDGNTTFYNLTNQNTANLNLVAGNTDIIIDNILNLENGTFNDNGNDISVYGDINNDATHVYGGSGDGISMLGISQQTMTGNGTYGKLTINNGNGIVLPVGNAPIITDYLKMVSGIFQIGGNLLTLGINCMIQEATPFGENNMIGTNISFTDYGVKKYFPSGAGSFTYPVGSVSGAENKYTPVVINVTQNSSTTGYLIVKPADERHPSIIDDSEGSDPDIVDMDNVLQYYWVLTANGFTDGSGTAEMYYNENDVEVTAPYDVYDYITAKLLSDGSGNWTKFDNVAKFDETNKKLIFDFTDASDVDIDGDYTAGVDGSSFLGAIPDQVPLYVSKGILGTGPYVGLDWHTADTWRVDDGTGTWVTPASIGLPDIPNGSRVRIVAGDRVTTAANYISAYTTDILGTLDVGTTFAHRIGNVTGTGTLYSEIGTLPGGYYEDFFLETGGTLEFGGSDSYSVLSNISQINNIIFSGTGNRELPNLNLIVLGDFTIAGDDATLKVINEFDEKLDLRSEVVFNSGSFDAGTGADAIVEFNGTSGAQSISGTGSFTGTNAFNNVIMNNLNGITFSIPADIDNTLKFDNGIIHTDATNILTLESTLETIVTGAGIGKFVDGPLSKNMNNNGNFDFPIGNDARYGELSLYNVSASDYWTAEYYNDNPLNGTPAMNPTTINTGTGSYDLQVVSDNEYWRVKCAVAANAEIGLRYDAQSGMPVDNDMRIAEWFNLATDAWDDIASNSPSGGNITSNNANVSFNEFTNGNYFTIGTVHPPQTLTWDGSESIVWNLPANWNLNVVPTAVDDIIIPSSGVTNEPTIDIEAVCQAIDLQSGRILTINADKNLTAYGDFTLNGTFILKSPADEGASASFIDNGTITGSGTIQVERYMSANKFHYVSSPIQNGGNATSALFTRSNPSGNFNPNFYLYNESMDLDGNPATAPSGAFDSDNLVAGWYYAHNGVGGADLAMNPKAGYAFYTDANQLITYTGKPNTGDMTVTGLTLHVNDAVAGPLPNYYDGWNLVGNPYPSAIDWDLVSENLNNIDNGIYVWDGNQYASYAGGVKGGSMNLSNLIAPMQAFYVHATADNAGFTLNNSQRTHSSENYLKSSENEQIANFIRLKMSANGFNDYAVIYFKSNASEGFDGTFDAFKLYSSNTQVPHIYSLTTNDATPLSVNALPKLNMENRVLPINIKIGQAGSYTISTQDFNFENTHVYFVDKYENKEFYLNDNMLSDYSFVCPAGEISDRFELRFFSNNPPQIVEDISYIEIFEDQLFERYFTNAFVENDANDEISGFTMKSFSGDNLPDWLHINTETGRIYGQPGNEDVGQISIEVGAYDKMGAVTYQIVTIEIINVNDEPILVNAIPDQNVYQNDNYSYTIPTNTFTDIDLGDQLSYKATLVGNNDLPEWLEFEGDTFKGKAKEDGEYLIMVTASDIDGASANDIFVLTVLKSVTEIDNTEQKIFVYPNPSNGKFTTITPDDEYTVTIISLGGKSLRTLNSSANKTDIDISDLASGVYFIELRSDNFREIYRLVLNK